MNRKRDRSAKTVATPAIIALAGMFFGTPGSTKLLRIAKL